MGAWGRGLLQNDTAQDGLVEVISSIEEDVAALAAGARPGERSAARLGAAVGLLLQLSSWHSFDPESEASATVVQAIDRHRPALSALPRKAAHILRRVAEGGGGELASRPAKLNRSLRRALFATESGGFPMERTFGKREASLFADRDAEAYVQKVARRCVELVDADFAEEDIVNDLARESMAMGAFATLLVIEPCRVPVAKVERWRKAHRRAMAAFEVEGEPDESDAEFEEGYEKCLELAFRLMVRKFSRR